MLGLVLPVAANSPALFTEQERQWLARHPQVTIAVNADWRPLEYVVDGEYRGLSAEYLRAVTRVSGLQFERAQGDESRLRGLSDNPRADLLPAVSRPVDTASVSGEMIYSRPYFSGSTLIVTRATAPIVFDMRQLAGEKVAVRRSKGFQYELSRRYPAIHFVTAESTSEALDQVASGSAYAAIDLDAVLMPNLRERYRDVLHVAGTVVDMPGVVSMGVRASEPMLLSIIDKSLATLTAEETDRMMAQWLESSDYGPPSWSALLRYYRVEAIALAGCLILFALLAYRALVEQRRAQRSERDKAMFLAVMSHEIRTPMNAILSSVELLGRSPLSPDDARLAQVAVTGANVLLDLLDDVLDFSRIEAGKLELDLRPADLETVLREALSIAEVRAQEKNLPLQLRLDLPAAYWPVIDAHRLRQVIINLLSNAIKFTEQGGVEVSATLKAEPGGGQRGDLRIAVLDSGIGISRRQQARLFQAFSQVDESRTRRHDGSGLGLTICRSLIGLMGGTITLQSEPGQGTTVTVAVPVELALAADEPAAPLAVPAWQAAGTSLQVLVIEDHPQNQFVIERQLHALGHRVTQAVDGAAGLQRLREEVFDLVLLDLNLPDLDGYAVARAWRQSEAQRPGARHTPIIAISAQVGNEHTRACFAAGMDEVLAKPLRIDQLREVIEEWCRPQAPTVSAVAALQMEDDGPLRAAFFDTTENDLAHLHQALRGGEIEQVARLAHRIAGAALMMGMNNIARLSRQLEESAAQRATPSALQSVVEQLQEAVLNERAQP